MDHDGSLLRPSAAGGWAAVHQEQPATATRSFIHRAAGSWAPDHEHTQGWLGHEVVGSSATRRARSPTTRRRDTTKRKGTGPSTKTGGPAGRVGGRRSEGDGSAAAAKASIEYGRPRRRGRGGEDAGRSLPGTDGILERGKRPSGGIARGQSRHHATPEDRSERHTTAPNAPAATAANGIAQGHHRLAREHPRQHFGAHHHHREEATGTGPHGMEVQQRIGTRLHLVQLGIVVVSLVWLHGKGDKHHSFGVALCARALAGVLQAGVAVLDTVPYKYCASAHAVVESIDCDMHGVPGGAPHASTQYMYVQLETPYRVQVLAYLVLTNSG
ncbi:hypothetical protein RJ55_08026 [Drechmeria coniospora]|nr:hypothetical protein RJ55_08026 [Drechmeria coniospora]